MSAALHFDSATLTALEAEQECLSYCHINCTVQLLDRFTIKTIKLFLTNSEYQPQVSDVERSRSKNCKMIPKIWKKSNPAEEMVGSITTTLDSSQFTHTRLTAT